MESTNHLLGLFDSERQILERVPNVNRLALDFTFEMSRPALVNSSAEPATEHGGGDLAVAPTAPLDSDSNSVLVVTGPMRSGTTLMGEFLSPRASRRSRHRNLAFDNDQTEAIPSVLKSEVLAPEQRSMVQADFMAAVSAVSESPIATVFGCKKTHLFQGSLEVLRAKLGRVNGVLMARDPRGIVSSYIHRPTLPIGADRYLILGTLLKYQAELALWDRDLESIVLRYEDLVKRPEPSVSKVLSLAGLDPTIYERPPLQSMTSNSSFGPGRGLQLSDSAGISTHAFHWRVTLSPLEISSIELLLAEYFDRFGYSRHSRIRDALTLSYLQEVIGPDMLDSFKKYELDLEPFEMRLNQLGIRLRVTQR